MSKISNVLSMIEYLSTGRKYSIAELSEKLEVTPRMIRVYKDEIEKAGIYIDTIKGPYGGYVLNQSIIPSSLRDIVHWGLDRSFLLIANDNSAHRIR